MTPPLFATDDELVRVKAMRRLVRRCLELERQLTECVTVESFEALFAELRRCLAAAYDRAHGCESAAFTVPFVFEPIDGGTAALFSHFPDYLLGALRGALGVYRPAPLDPTTARLAMARVPGLLRSCLLVPRADALSVFSDSHPIASQTPGLLTHPLKREAAMASLDLADLPPAFIDDTRELLLRHRETFSCAPLARQWLDVLAECDAVRLALVPCADLRTPEVPGGMAVVVSDVASARVRPQQWSRDFRLSVDRDLSRIGWHFVPFLRAHDLLLRQQPPR